MKERNTVVIGLLGCLGLFVMAACLSVALFAAYSFGRDAATPIAEQSDIPALPTLITAQEDEPLEITPVLTPLAPPTTAGDGDLDNADNGDDVVQENPTVVPPPQPTAAPFNIEELNTALLEEVLRIVDQQFDGDMPSADILMYAAINGALSSLDDEFTRFAPPEVAARMREGLSGSFQGIGAFVRMTDDGQVQIARPMAGFPAALAGVQAGDIILAVDGRSIAGMLLDEAVSLVRGPQDTAVTLTLQREGVDDPFDITIVRAVIEIPLVEAEMLENDIAYIRLTSFSRNARSQLESNLADLLAQNPQALIFDLRDNGGGFLDQSVAVADLFLPEGVVLLERNRRGLDEIFRSHDGDIAESIPMVLLVNAGSASASEIVAGAIQDNGRAVIIGEVTFGKGSVQQSHNLSDGSELRVTIARWYTPNNQSIDGQGITPDIESGPSPDEFLGPDDVQLQRAIQYILEGR
jgi:carboxyl-terminal processing protease